MTAEYSKRAIADLGHISAYYLSEAGPEVADRFETRLRAVVARISKRPEMFPSVSRRRGVHVALLVSFPYKVFYRTIGGDRIRVLHIRHTARRPWEQEQASA